MNEKMKITNQVSEDVIIPGDSPPPKAIQDELDKLWKEQFLNKKTEIFKPSFNFDAQSSDSPPTLRKSNESSEKNSEK